MPFTLSTNVTGRDRDLIIQALLYALTTIEQLPPNRHEWSDAEDMRTLLDHLVPDAAQRDAMLREARSLVTGEGAS